MGAWTDAVEAKARIIHGQMLAARTLANSNGAAPDGVERPYLDLLNELYRNEFLFAQLVDSSDLVARFEGPALSGRDPTMSIVTSMFSSLRKQIQGIAKSRPAHWRIATEPLLTESSVPISTCSTSCIAMSSYSLSLWTLLIWWLDLKVPPCLAATPQCLLSHRCFPRYESRFRGLPSLLPVWRATNECDGRWSSNHICPALLRAV